MSLVYGRMPKKLPCNHKLYVCVENDSHVRGDSPSIKHLKLIKSAESEHETVNCVADCEELQLKGCTAETVITWLILS